VEGSRGAVDCLQGGWPRPKRAAYWRDAASRRFYASNYYDNKIKLYEVTGPGIVTLVDSIAGPMSGLNLPDGIAIGGARVGPVHP
jgi:hypothetical protein